MTDDSVILCCRTSVKYQQSASFTVGRELPLNPARSVAGEM